MEDVPPETDRVGPGAVLVADALFLPVDGKFDGGFAVMVDALHETFRDVIGG